jgi:tetratricopeptide (TPR) repeat protein
MSKISLRAYIREIEGLIAKDQADLGAAHCRQILAVFPRYITASRLLGNACLQAADFAAAKTAYLQVLASLPDDLVTHIGLSIIMEINAELEPAAWHMQRAFEIQPANLLLRAELQRLITLRDRAEPSNILLSRYALARMYLKGGLYPQASTEILAALAEEPQRLDLHCLLVQVYRQSGMIELAAQAALPVLEKLPDCLEANLALDLAGAASDGPGEKSPARRRLEALDPYYAGVSPQVPTLQQVPDSLIELERLQ